MKQNRTDPAKEKGVKFKMSDSEEEDNLSEESKNETKSQIYTNIESAENFALKAFNECDSLFRALTENDPYAKKSDTVTGIVAILKRLTGVLELLNKAPQSDKEELFHLVYNCSLYMFDYCRVLRKSIYGLLCVRYLKEILISMESNIILLKSKYMEWRVKIYIELIRIYEENGSLKSALELALKAADAIKKQKDLEELDPPVPEYSKLIYSKCLHYLNTFVLKFQLQSGEQKIDFVKTKIKDQFPKEEQNKDKLATLMEILSVNNKSFNIFRHDGKKKAWREQMVEFAYDQVKQDITFISSYLEEKSQDLEERAKRRESRSKCD